MTSSKGYEKTGRVLFQSPTPYFLKQPRKRYTKDLCQDKLPLGRDSVMESPENQSICFYFVYNKPQKVDSQTMHLQ